MRAELTDIFNKYDNKFGAAKTQRPPTSTPLKVRVSMHGTWYLVLVQIALVPVPWGLVLVLLDLVLVPWDLVLVLG